MRSMLGREYRVYIQSRDGSEVIEMPGIVTNLEMSCRHDEQRELTLTIVSTGPSTIGPGYAPRPTHVERLTNNKEEWACDWCGRPNNMEHQYCQSCSAVRSFTIQNKSRR